MPPRNAAPPPHDDAFHAAITIGNWVNNADTKIGLLGAALTILTGAVVRQRSRVEALTRAPLHTREWAALALLSASVIALAVAAWYLYYAIRPRLSSDKPSRFSFPYLAVADLATLVNADPVQVRREAWIQAQALSRIVLAKYHYFSKALTFGLISGLTFVGWMLTVPSKLG
jgi:hypothetical protein